MLDKSPRERPTAQAEDDDQADVQTDGGEPDEGEAPADGEEASAEAEGEEDADETASDDLDLTRLWVRSKIDDDADARAQLAKHGITPVRSLVGSYVTSLDMAGCSITVTMLDDEIAKAHFLCIRSNVKNYDGEIQHFIDWITPCLDKHPGDFLGFRRYEETEDPTLIYMPGEQEGKQ